MKTTRPARRRRLFETFGIGLVVASLALGSVLASGSTASALDPGAVVAKGTPVSAKSGTLWGTAATGGAYTYPYGTQGNVTNGSGVGDAGMLQMQPGMSAAAVLAGASQRDITVTSCFAIEWPASSGTGVRYSTHVRTTAKGSYRAMLLVSPTGTAALSLVRENATPASSTTLARHDLATKVPGKSTYCVDFEAEGDSTVLLRSRVYPTGTTPPAWQATATDTSATRIAEAGGLSFIGYASGNNAGVTRLRVANFTGKALVAETPEPEPETTTYGSAPLGSTNYPIPTDKAKVVYVDPASGDPSADVRPSDYLFDRTHTQIVCNQKPDKTNFPLVDNTTASLARAIKWVPDGGTIVLRSGVYHEQIMICEGKKFTIQAAPRAVVWLDGSVPVTGWRQEGSRWVKDGWTAEFDSSPTFTWGAQDGTGSWQFVNPDYPMAAHPDQVFVNGTPLTQVASVDKVTATSFFVDDKADKIYIGANPSGQEVRASDLQTALNFATAGITVRGIGIRNYATSVPQKGAVRVHSPATAMTFENVVLENNAAAGIHLAANNVTLTNITTRTNGIAGIYASKVAGLAATNLSVTGNNTERFNMAPAAAGIKITGSSTVSIKDSELVDNYATGIWLDEEVRGFDILNNSIERNNDAGVLAEISYDGRIVNNVVRDNAQYGIWIFGTENAKIWNNSVTGSRHPFMVRQDARINASTNAPWTTRETVVANNIIGNVPAGSEPWCPVVCVYDQTNSVPASTLVPTLTGNVYHRTAASNPAQLFRWPTDPAKHTTSYPTLTAFRAATTLDPTAIELTGTLPLTDRGLANADLHKAAGPVAIPADIATLMGATAGSKVIGPVRK